MCWQIGNGQIRWVGDLSLVPRYEMQPGPLTEDQVPKKLTRDHVSVDVPSNQRHYTRGRVLIKKNSAQGGEVIQTVS